jgi:inositol polyphosphate 5-phosphatase INPP5B/F
VPDDIVLNEWLANSETAPDIYAVGFQEIDMSPQCILTHEQRPDRVWVDKIKGGLHPGAKYIELKTIRLVGMMLTVFIKASLQAAVKSYDSDMVGTGPMGMGNKGGLGISLILNEASICFINSHLAAHLAEVERRNEDHDEIIRRMQFIDGIGKRTVDDHQ